MFVYLFFVCMFLFISRTSAIIPGVPNRGKNKDYIISNIYKNGLKSAVNLKEKAFSLPP